MGRDHRSHSPEGVSSARNSPAVTNFRFPEKSEIFRSVSLYGNKGILHNFGNILLKCNGTLLIVINVLHRLRTALHKLRNSLHKLRNSFHRLRTTLHKLRTTLHKLRIAFHKLSNSHHKLRTAFHKLRSALQMNRNIFHNCRNAFHRTDRFYFDTAQKLFP